MKKISYAQNHEDVLLHRPFPDRSDGFYIDVGACHPIFHSVTKHSYDRGWNGINIEPMPGMYDTLPAIARGTSTSTRGSRTARDIDLLRGPRRDGLFDLLAGACRRPPTKRLLRSRAPHTRHDPVPGLREVRRQTIDFFKIDVEGTSARSSKGRDWDHFRPRVVLIEATRPGTNTPSHNDWEKFLLAADYLFASFDGLNRYYVREEDRDSSPCSACRRMCWTVSYLSNTTIGLMAVFHRQVQGFQRQIEEIRGSWRNRCAWASRAAAPGSFARSDGVITASSSSAQRPWAR